MGRHEFEECLCEQTIFIYKIPCNKLFTLFHRFYYYRKRTARTLFNSNLSELSKCLICREMTVMTDVVLQTLLAAVMFSTVYVLYLKLSQPVADFLDGYSQVGYS